MLGWRCAQVMNWPSIRDRVRANSGSTCDLGMGPTGWKGGSPAKNSAKGAPLLMPLLLDAMLP